MTALVKLLRTGKFRHRLDSNQHGVVDVYYVSNLLLDDVDHRLQVVNIIKSTLGTTTHKWGAPLSSIEPVRISASKAVVNVTWGRMGGSGGFFHPIAFSRVDHSTETLTVPAFYGRSNDPSDSYLKQYTRDRAVTTVVFDERIQETDYPAALQLTNALKGRMLSLLNLGDFVFRGADFKRLRSNEIRGRLTFVQTAAVHDLTVAYAADRFIPALGVLGEYRVVDSGTFPVEAMSKEDLYVRIEPETAFNQYWNFDY